MSNRSYYVLQRKQYHLFREGHTQGLSITPSQIEVVVLLYQVFLFNRANAAHANMPFYISFLQKLESIGFRSIVKPAVADPSETKNKPSKQKAHVDLWNERYLELKVRISSQNE